MSDVFHHENQGIYQKALEVIAGLGRLLGYPVAPTGLPAQLQQSGVNLAVRIAEALNATGSSERVKYLESALFLSVGLAAMLDALNLHGGGTQTADIQSLKGTLFRLHDELTVRIKSATAHKQLRSRIR